MGLTLSRAGQTGQTNLIIIPCQCREIEPGLKNVEIGDLNQPLKKDPLITDETEIIILNRDETTCLCIYVIFKFLLYIHKGLKKL